MGLLPLSFSGLLNSSQQQRQNPETAQPCTWHGDSLVWHPAHSQDVSWGNGRWDRDWGKCRDGAEAAGFSGSTASRCLCNLERKGAFVLTLCFKGLVT